MKRNTNTTPKNAAPVPATVRCAVYTRKSTEEGLEQAFNSLDAQRESGELFVRSHAGEGWTLVPDRYDDGGFTGGNMDRPALLRLMADIEAGRIDTVVVYKVDRLSRSLLDFAKMMRTFDERKVSFVSVTQQLNTATSMGRLVLNVLLSFAQFEREIISERTRDKIAATRRKGKWTGGWPVLGYDVDRQHFKLVVNPSEAERVRAIFQLYLKHESLLPVVLELDRLGWSNKEWSTRKGPKKGGKPFTRTSLYKLLTNVVYIGKVRYKDEVHAGEQAALIDQETWSRVQAMLERNGRSGGEPVRNKFGALLKGLIRCAPCGCAMTPSHSTRAGSRRYRYYVCSSAQKRGWHTCPSKSVPAAGIEELVVGQLKKAATDPKLLHEVLQEAIRKDQARIAEWESERRGLEQSLLAWNAEMHSLVGRLQANDEAQIAHLADLQERMTTGESRLRLVRERIETAKHRKLEPDEAIATLSNFDLVWGALSPREQVRTLRLIVERVDYDGIKGKVAIAFHPSNFHSPLVTQGTS